MTSLSSCHGVMSLLVIIYTVVIPRLERLKLLKHLLKSCVKQANCVLAELFDTSMVYTAYGSTLDKKSFSGFGGGKNNFDFLTNQ